MVCSYCSLNLGFWNRLLGRRMHPGCRERQEAERRKAGDDLRALLEQIAKDPSSAPS
jgi:hypothetical protein